ncbi:hypothetical protein QR685DRAFT_442022, partial [Neurospora intermedia]
NFYIDLSKYEFYIKRVLFLGYIISLEGILINLERIVIIKEEAVISVYNIEVLLRFIKFY